MKKIFIILGGLLVVLTFEISGVVLAKEQKSRKISTAKEEVLPIELKEAVTCQWGSDVSEAVVSLNERLSKGYISHQGGVATMDINYISSPFVFYDAQKPAGEKKYIVCVSVANK